MASFVISGGLTDRILRLTLGGVSLCCRGSGFICFDVGVRIHPEHETTISHAAASCLSVDSLKGLRFSKLQIWKRFLLTSARTWAMVNEERAVAKVSPLTTDDLQTQVATKHAQSMLLMGS